MKGRGRGVCDGACCWWSFWFSPRVRRRVVRVAAMKARRIYFASNVLIGVGVMHISLNPGDPVLARWRPIHTRETGFGERTPKHVVLNLVLRILSRPPRFCTCFLPSLSFVK